MSLILVFIACSICGLVLLRVGLPDLGDNLTLSNARHLPFYSLIKMASAAERLSDGASEEKKIAHDDHIENDRHTIENLPDPDAGLSDEERAAHVLPPLSPVPS